MLKRHIDGIEGDAVFFYPLSMESAYEQAKKSAVEKVLLSIAETGSPTDSQLAFLRMMKPKEDSLDELSKALKVADSFLGVAK